jgi:hypothetical protein
MNEVFWEMRNLQVVQSKVVSTDRQRNDMNVGFCNCDDNNQKQET